MKKLRVFLSEIFQFLEVKVSIYLNRRVLVMGKLLATKYGGWEGGVVNSSTSFLLGQTPFQEGVKQF